jgi:hypothetical protein
MGALDSLVRKTLADRRRLANKCALMPKGICLSADEVRRLVELALMGFPGPAIARELHCSVSTVQKYARQEGLSLRQPLRSQTVRISFDAPEFHTVCYHAARRGMRPNELCRVICAVVFAENLLDAILDVRNGP